VVAVVVVGGGGVGVGVVGVVGAVGVAVAAGALYRARKATVILLAPSVLMAAGCVLSEFWLFSGPSTCAVTACAQF